MATRTLNVVVAGDAKGFDKATRQATGSLDRLDKAGTKTLSRLKTGMLAVGAAAAGGLAIGIKKSAEAAIEAEKANARLETQLKALGISYQAHEQQIQRVIDKHSQLSGFDDEDLGDSFTNIVRVVGDVNKALELNALAADIARARHMDVAQAGELVGKVAGGNIGILSRYGIVVKDGASATEALGTLQQKFAGQAEAYGNTTAGAQDRARVAFENLGETLGARITPIIARVAEGFNELVRQITLGEGPGGRIRRVFERLAAQAVNVAEKIRDLVGWFRRHKTTTDILLSVITGLTAAFVAYKVAVIAATIATRAMAAAAFLLNIALRANPIGLVVTALIALGAALVTAYKRSETFRRIVGVAFEGAKRGAQAASRVFNAVFLPALNAIAAAAEKVWGALKKVGGIIGAVSGAASDAAGFLNPFGDGLGKTAVDISGLGGGGGLMGADADLAPFAALGRNAGLRVSSGLRVGSVTSSGNQSYHATGDAIDLAGAPANMMRFATTMRSRFGKGLRELIYTPMGIGIKDGRPYQYSGQVAQDHYDHVHVAYTGPFGDGIGQAVQAARKAGFRGQALINAVAIAGAESKYDAEALNQRYPDYSVGMWQINMLAHGKKYGTEAQLKNPFTNAVAAFKISGGGKNFGPWSTWPSAARGWMDRARAAVQGSGGGRGGPSAMGGGRGGPSAEGPSSRTETPTGPGARLGIEGQLAREGVREARARASDNLGKLIASWKRQRQIKRRRLRIVSKALRGKMRKARRIRLLGEQAQLVEEIDALNESIAEYSADQAGGATTITEAEELEAGVATGGGDTGGGGDNGASALASELAALRASIDASRKFAEQVQQTESFVLKKYLADVLSGQIVGYGVVPRSFTPGSGVEYSY
jgi:hypothetical protein